MASRQCESAYEPENKYIYCDKTRILYIFKQVFLVQTLKNQQTDFSFFRLSSFLMINRGFARQSCCMAGTIKMFCIRRNFFSLRKTNLLFLPCNVAAVHCFIFCDVDCFIALSKGLWFQAVGFEINYDNVMTKCIIQ